MGIDKIQEIENGDTVSTKIYGASDDLIEFEGDITEESNKTKDGESSLVICSDDTMLEIKYGKGSLGIWQITPIKMGELFKVIEICTNEDANPYSDIAYFNDGLLWVYVCVDWEKLT